MPLRGSLVDKSNNVGAKLVKMLEEVEEWNKAHTGPVEPLGVNTYTGPSTVEFGVEVFNPFTAEICTADLIRCPEADPLAEVDSLDYFSKEYVRSVRLLKVKQRWCYATPSDWYKDVNVLIAAMDNDANHMDPWPPLSKWLALFHVSVQGSATRMRSKIKIVLLKKLEAMAKMKMGREQSDCDRAA
jgi:hypothetical protein